MPLLKIISCYSHAVKEMILFRSHHMYVYSNATGFTANNRLGRFA